MNKETKIKIGERAGLSFTGKYEAGEPEFVGTDIEFSNASKLVDKTTEERFRVRLYQRGSEESALYKNFTQIDIDNWEGIGFIVEVISGCCNASIVEQTGRCSKCLESV